MSQSAVAASPTPLSDLNTTPLIDVLLVLLVMFIITIPVATHSTDIDLPQCNDCTPPPLSPLKNVVSINAADQLFWNGQAITNEELAIGLAQTRALAVEPELQFEPAALASYDAAVRALDVIKRSGVTKFGIVGNQKYRSFASS